MTYKHYPNRAQTLTKEFVQSEYEKLTSRLSEAEASETGDLWVKLFTDWNALKSYVGSEGSRIQYKLSADMSDPTVEVAEKYFREEVVPASDDGYSAMVNALLKSKHKGAVAKRYGDYLIKHLETNVEPLAPINSDLRVKEGDLVNRYDKLVSSGEVTIDGKVVTLAVARSMQSSDNLALRRESFAASRGWFIEHHDEIGNIFAEMVQVRDQMAKNLGHENYLKLGYLGMSRTDYGPKDAEQFRANVLKYAVPLYKRVCEAHAEELGTPTLRPWDTSYRPSLTLPVGIAPVATQLEKAQVVFDSLSPRLGAHFKRMRDERLIDLENRKGKRAGAFCTSFSDEGRVAILCNSTGDEGDVSTLMHEMGHAFQAWESQKIEAVDLQWPTSDAAEIHSMSMEFLSMKKMREFFSDENVEKVRKDRWVQSISLLCYICVVDEFQHWVYSNPKATLAERDQMWNQIWDKYIPGVDYAGLDAEKASRWYIQGHIFGMPFYYIDYAIAETGAMQFALIDASDPDKALATYLTICEIGGQKSVLNIFKSAGMRSPFEEALMKDLMEHAAEELDVEVYA